MCGYCATGCNASCRCGCHALARFNAGTARARLAYVGRDAQLDADQAHSVAMYEAHERLRAGREALAARVIAIHQEAAIRGRAKAMAEVDAEYEARTKP